MAASEDLWTCEACGARNTPNAEECLWCVGPERAAVPDDDGVADIAESLDALARTRDHGLTARLARRLTPATVSWLRLIVAMRRMDLVGKENPQ